MITDRVQRSRERRQSWRPAGEPFEPGRHEVAEIAGEGADNLCRAFVVRHHYAATYPAARRRFGLFRDAGELVGVAVFSMPWQRSLDRISCPWDNRDVLELSRFVLLDHVEGNGESWFLARCFELLWRKGDGFAGVLSYSDPQQRTGADGALVFPGHIGTIYQAHNAIYLGRASKRTLHIFDDGGVFSERDMSKIRSGERGQDYAIQLLVDRGAERPGPAANMKQWLGAWRQSLCRPLRHPGNHTYLWALHRNLKRYLPAGQAYPKATFEVA
jgi:hypothetical protein